MKGQSEIVTFVLLFLIGVILFVSAVAWSGNLFERNVDLAKITSAENFMTNLDKEIQSIIKFGGQKTINYNIDGTIELIEGDPDKIEIKTPANVVVPDYWINISSSESHGVIQEMLDGNIFRIHLFYPVQDNYGIDLFTEGPRLATPSRIKIEKEGTITRIIDNEDYIFVRVKITFE